MLRRDKLPRWSSDKPHDESFLLIPSTFQPANQPDSFMQLYRWVCYLEENPSSCCGFDFVHKHTWTKNLHMAHCTLQIALMKNHANLPSIFIDSHFVGFLKLKFYLVLKVDVITEREWFHVADLSSIWIDRGNRKKMHTRMYVWSSLEGVKGWWIFSVGSPSLHRNIKPSVMVYLVLRPGLLVLVLWRKRRQLSSTLMDEYPFDFDEEIVTPWQSHLSAIIPPEPLTPRNSSQ